MSHDDDNDNPEGQFNKDKHRPTFHVFTNPLDMERFFNQQMEEILKSFGVFGSFRDENARDRQGPGFPTIEIPGHFQKGLDQFYGYFSASQHQ